MLPKGCSIRAIARTRRAFLWTGGIIDPFGGIAAVHRGAPHKRTL
jgi:hypothetical protein